MKTFTYIQRLFLILLMSSACTVFGQSARQYYKVSKEFIEKGNMQDALNALTKAIEINPKYVDAYIARAGVFEKMANISSALEDYNRAIVFEPKDEFLYYEAGRMDFLLKKYEDALQQFDKALEMKKGYLEVFPYKIKSQIALNRLNEAAVVCQIALKYKENATHLFLAGQVSELQKKFYEAENYYLKALMGNVNSVEVYLALANLQLTLRKPDKAIESSSTVLSVDPNNILAYILRSKADTMKLDYSNAINDVSKAILVKPENEELFMLRAEYYYKFTQYQSAINDFSKVLHLNSGSAKAYYSRAAAYEQIGNYKLAIKDYESLVRLSELDVEAKKLLDNAKLRLFELNRESNPPQLVLVSPESYGKSMVQLPKGKGNISIKAHVNDESDLKYFRINDYSMPLGKNSNGYTFTTEINLEGKDEFTISVSDVYDNVTETKYRITRNETDPPIISLIAPYASDNEQIYIDSNDPNLFIEGNLKDESKIRSILIDGVSASYILDEINPVFSATINIQSKNKFTITATDTFGNQSEKTFRINREEAVTLAENPMGKSWVVFIENSKYGTFASLEGPTKDVVLMKRALAKYKINNIIHKKDMSKKDMERFFSIELRDLIRSNRVNTLLIWYAGHGKFINETGYWIPVDANRDDEFTYFNINNLRASLQSYTNLTHTLVVTDACESGPTFYQAMRGQGKERNCSDWQAVKFKSSQVFSSAGYELAVDNSQFTRTFANILANNPDACIPIESIVNKVNIAVKQNNQQLPKFGKISGLADEDGTFFFMTKQ